MSNKVTIDQTGRVVLPKTVRDELHLMPGDVLDVDVQDDTLILRPRRAANFLHKERGIWVFGIGKPLAAADAADAIRSVRMQRDRHNAG